VVTSEQKAPRQFLLSEPNHLHSHPWRIIMKKALIAGLVLGVAMSVGCVAMADTPFPYVDIGFRHGNLRNAQEDIAQAWQLVDQAQYANNYQLDGHAARAKELLFEANQELRMAATTANHNGY
jgi:hypothetical protein